MPQSDIDEAIIVDAEAGHYRTTKTWVLGRFLRDENGRLSDKLKSEATHQRWTTKEEIHVPTVQLENLSNPAQPKQPWEALRITVYEVDPDPPCPHGVPTLDLVWYSGFAIIFIQLVIAMLAWVLNANWTIFLVTATGNALALAGGSLPQWKVEKWSCPKTGGGTVIITQGNGSRHAIVILGRWREMIGLDLEVLARGMRTARASLVTRIASVVLALLWIVLLVTVAGLRENTWCMSFFILDILDLS